MTTTAEPVLTPSRVEPGVRKAVLALARIHLRLGALTLARTELETLAGLGALDPAGLVDLAEVRWRTGDLPGAGEAASAAIEAGGDEPVALVIAAEAAALDGRLGEARRLASQALGDAHGGIDAIFAGMPRATIWPADAAEPAPAAATLFQREADESVGSARARAASAAGAESAAGMVAGSGVGAQGHGRGGDPGAAMGGSAGTAGADAAGASAVAALTLWDSDGETGASLAALPDPSETLEAARIALVAGSLDEAALRFGLALRLAPALAPAVLEATEGVRASGLIVVRGDAYRLVGHEAEARTAYALAAQGGLPDRRKTQRHRPKKVAGTGAAAGDGPVSEGAETIEAVTPTDGTEAIEVAATTKVAGTTEVAATPEATGATESIEDAGTAEAAETPASDTPVAAPDTATSVGTPDPEISPAEDEPGG